MTTTIAASRRPAHRAASRRVDRRRLARERMRRRRRRSLVLALLLAAAVLVAVDVARSGTADPLSASATGHDNHQPQQPAPPPRSSVQPAPTASGGAGAATVSYPRAGSGQYLTAPGRSAVLGQSGTLLRFQVAVEKDIWNLDAGQFADKVVQILGDPRGWTAGGDWRFQRVGPGQPHDFTLYLVTPGTRDKLCHDNPDGYTSCRYEDSVVLNVSRWVHGVSYYPDLEQYRDYAVSHEVGHRLGHTHELCPGAGQPAPTMQQQTLGLHGCTSNPWPYLDGKRYAGKQGDYDQTNIPKDPAGYYRR